MPFAEIEDPWMETYLSMVGAFEVVVGNSPETAGYELLAILTEATLTTHFNLLSIYETASVAFPEKIRPNTLDALYGLPITINAEPNMPLTEAETKADCDREIAEMLGPLDASTDTTRKIATLRAWHKNPNLIRSDYLAEIANEFERIYKIMIGRARRIADLENMNVRAPQPLASAQISPERDDSTDHIDWDKMAEERLGQRPRASASAQQIGNGGALSREALIEIIMRETTDDIVADGWDRLGQPNVLIQGCKFIRRNARTDPTEGYAEPEVAAHKFAALVADAIRDAEITIGASTDRGSK